MFLKFAFVALISVPLWAAEFVVPPLSGPVVDEAGMIDRATAVRLAAALRRVLDDGGPQFAVLTMPDLAGLDISEASIKVVDRWQLGAKDKDNGILILVAKNERAVRIEVGQGLEGSLPDAYARRIIDNVMIPHFRSGDVGSGLVAGAGAILERVAPQVSLGLDSAAPRGWRRERGQGPPAWAVVILVMFVLFASAVSRLFHGRWRYGGILGGGNHWGGGSWGSLGGGGSGGFGTGGGVGGGGGGFSGGGASGRW